MANIEPVMFQGREIIPLEFLKAVLPDPGELGENYTGQTSIGVRIRGKKDGNWVNYYIWNNCQHADAYKETGTQGVSYTTGVPAMVGAKMFLTGQWSKPGVYNVEEFNPDPFMELLNVHGLPWNEEVNGVLPHTY
jgi:saccharopine dehydrogenase (NAD+, L-lysine-forming)